MRRQRDRSVTSGRTMDGPPENDVCSICHSNFHTPSQANCSHWFCASCILQVWDHGAALHPCKCPLCRREITLLVPSESSSRQRYMDDVAEILQRIERYNRLYGQSSNSLMQRMQDLPFLLRRLLRDITNPQRSLPFVIKARVYLAVKLSLLAGLFSYLFQSTIQHPNFLVIVSVIYVLSPVDIIPEGLLGVLGLLDDLIIVFICFMYVAALYRAYLLSRHGGS